MRRLLALTVAFALVSHAPPAAAAEPVRAGLEVDTSALGEAAEGVRAQILSAGNQTRLDADIARADSPDDPVIKVVVTPVGADEGFSLQVSLARGGETLETLARMCDMCTEGELTEKAATAIGELIPKLRNLAEAGPSSGATDDPPDPAPAVDPTGTADPAAGPELEPMPPDRERPGLGPAGYAGIAGLALGVAGIGVGAVLVARGKRLDPNGEGGEDLLNFRPPGYAALGIGGALLVTGAVLIAVDRVRARGSASARRDSRQLVTIPWATPDGAGIGLSGRF